jgi:hypothetical protein
MPYSGINDDTLPDRIKEKPADIRDVFVRTFNGTFEQCQKQGGDDCEGRAMRIANTAVRRSEQSENMTNFLFIELVAPLTDGKPFDAFAIGRYIDMMGREVEFKRDDLPEYVANTQAAIEATRSESGEVVGLPIDAMNHDKGNAAGWIVGIELAGNVIRFIPQWTELGRELISKGLQRFFSATVDIAAKTISGGSLTNWPAMKEGGRNKLRPVELSEQLREIVHSDDSQEVINMAKENEPEIKEEKKEPAFDLAALREEIKADILAEFQAKTADDEAKERLAEAVKLEAFAEVADLSQAREEMLAQMQAALLSEYNRMQANAGNMLADMMRQIKRDQHIAEFSQRVTAGTDNRPYGLPVGQEEVETFLMSLNDQQREAAESILSRTHETGLVQFSELGHGKRFSGTVTFPSEFSAPLTSWIADGNSMKEFFKINPELGEMSQYNLDEYKEAE